MKNTFILDENVFIQSFACRDIKASENNYNSLYLILWIREKCHKIGLTSELGKKYKEWSKIFNKDRVNWRTIKIWKDILARKDKQRWCANHLKGLPSNIEHDRHVIEPAIYLKGVLVTTDEKLRERLAKWAEEKGYEIVIKSPEDILREENQS